MFTKYPILGLGVATVFFCLPLAAQTEPDGETDIPTDEGEAQDHFFGASLGLKGGFGGNYLSKPDNTLPGTLPFDGGAGGIGGGGGIYTEFRILWDHLGLEVDFLFDRSKNWCNIEYNGLVDTDWIYHQTALRIPVLLKGALSKGITRASLGIGPEFVVGLAAETDIEVNEGEQYLGPGGTAALRSIYSASTQTDVFLAFDLGLAFLVWNLAITVDLRYAYNLTQPKDYEDRVELDSSLDPTTNEWQLNQATTAASNSMDLRLMLGISYEFGF
jgi:hypothetical protein